MKPGAFFINTSRSSVVDEAALLQAVEEKGIRAALDVFSDEPSYKEGDFSHPFAHQGGIYLTHHIGASTVQAQEEIADEAARVILTYADSNVVPNCVNISRVSDARYQLTVRHLDKVGVLAFVLNEMSKAHWNVQEMQNLIFADGEAACAVIRFDGLLDDSVLGRIQANSDILALTVIDL
jgi:D-3-phosphoglycerate dehydrogenase